MPKVTRITLDQLGNMKVDATGFKGKACADTTDKLLKGLGAKATKEIKKPEFNQLATTGASQHVPDKGYG